MELGLERFLAREHKKYRGLRLGVLCNQATVDQNLRHIRDTITDKRLGLDVTCFIGPQHGIRGEKQDNMIESDDFVDPRYQIPVYSLYGASREPGEKLLSGIDAFVVDLMDIGTRIYTFMYTMANCMRAAKASGKKVIVLDRPNPIDGISVEGNVLEPRFTSFVGQFPMPVRHGMTMGELALFFNETHGIGCDLDVIPVKGWKRKQHWDDWGRHWVPPSPNMPTYQAALTFPGCVHFEGTNVSEGRGTTKPFEWIGAPYADADRVAEVMNGMKLGGVYFQPIFFQPTFHKGKDRVCGGVHIHVLDRARFRPFLAGIRLLDTFASLYPKDFAWKEPPYEYEYEKMPIDLIAGTAALRLAVESRHGLAKFEEKAAKELAAFKKIRARHLLYKNG